MNIVDVVSSYDEPSSSLPEVSSSSRLSARQLQLHEAQQQQTLSHHHDKQHHHHTNSRNHSHQKRSSSDKQQPLRINANPTRRRTSGSSSSHDDHDSTATASNRDHILYPPRPSPAAKIIRHYRLVLLARVFFLVGSALFIGASYEDYKYYSTHPHHQHQMTFGPNNAFLHGSSSTPMTTGNSTLGDTQEHATTPEGYYHFYLSHSLETYISTQMMLLLGTTFCFLQVGIINFVRSPLDRYHLFQIMAGLLGLVSAMFWETRTVLSNIFYFFFVHAMTGQALMQFHSHVWSMILLPQSATQRQRQQSRDHPPEPTDAPPNHRTSLASQRKSDNRQSHTSHNNHDRSTEAHRPSSSPPRSSRRSQQQRRRLLSLSPTNIISRRQDGHFALDSDPEEEDGGRLSMSPSGLMMDDVDDESDSKRRVSSPLSFSRRQERGGRRFGSPLNLEDDDEDDDDELIFSVEPSYSLEDHGGGGGGSSAGALERGEDTEDEDCHSTKEVSHSSGDTIVNYGIGYCIADGFFIVGSAVELVVTYVAILSLPTDLDMDLPEEEANNQGGETDNISSWNAASKVLNFIPGVFWLISAILALVVTVLLHRFVQRQ